jgi:diaminopimelate decarboxylase
MKANPMPAVVQHMAGLVDGIDVASAGELKVALDTGMHPNDASASPAPASATRTAAGGRRRRACNVPSRSAK